MTAHVTCLGCGCACDDIEIVTRDSRIVDAVHACELGVRWFGDGRAPARSQAGDRHLERPEAIRAAAQLLRTASRPLVYLAPDLTCEAQRHGIGAPSVGGWRSPGLFSSDTVPCST